MRFRAELLFGIWLIVLTIGCAPKPEVNNAVIIKAGRLTYTLGELNKRFSQAAFESAEEEFEQKKSYLEQQLDKMILADGGLELGYGDSVVLDTNSLSTVIGNIVFEREVGQKVPDGSNDAEVRKFWDYYGGVIGISQIVTRDKRTCDSLYKILVDHPDKFAEIAATQSIDTASAQKGGDLGVIRVGTLIPEIEEKAFALKPGQMTKPFETIYGWHIVMMRDRKEYTEEDFKNQLARYRNLYINKTRKIAQNAFYEKMANHFKLEINRSALIMLSAKLDSIQRAERQQNITPRQFLASADLTPQEAAIPLAISKVKTLTVNDFIRHFETYRDEHGVDLTNLKMVRYVMVNKMAPFFASAYGRDLGIQNEAEFQRLVDDSRNAQVYRYMLMKVIGGVTVTEDEIRERYSANRDRYIDTSGDKPIIMTLEQVRPQIQNEILQEKREQARKIWLDERKKKVENYIDLDLLKENLITGKKKA